MEQSATGKGRRDMLTNFDREMICTEPDALYTVHVWTPAYLDIPDGYQRVGKRMPLAVAVRFAEKLVSQVANDFVYIQNPNGTVHRFVN